MEDFSKPKIMYSEIVRVPQFYFDDNGEFLPEASTFIITGANLKYLYQVFNCDLVAFIFKRFYAGGGLGEEGYRYKKAFLERLPIPYQSNCHTTSTKIRTFLMKKYELSSDEIKFIDSQ